MKLKGIENYPIEFRTKPQRRISDHQMLTECSKSYQSQGEVLTGT